MNNKIINLKDAKLKELEGRRMYMLVNAETMKTKNISMVLIRVDPGETVRPCHSHPQSEEVIYITKGKGEALIDGEISSFDTNSVIFFPKGSKHMIRNTGSNLLEALCVFSPPASPETYKLYSNIEFEKR